MGLIKFFEEDFNIEEDNYFEAWRDMNLAGIFTVGSEEVRNLHAQMSMIHSQKIFLFGQIEFDDMRCKLFMEMKRNALLHDHYNTDTVAGNNAAVANDPDYVIVQDTYLTAHRVWLTMKAEINALESAINALSREMTNRMKV